jgi:hypothetical protein
MRDPSGRLPMAEPELESALRDLGGALAFPARAEGPGGAGALGALDPARRARLRIEQGSSASSARPRPWAWLAPNLGPLFGGHVRRSLVLALIAVIVVAAVAAALGLGLPGIRIVTAPSASAGATGAAPSGSPEAGASGSSASPGVAGPPGTGMGLGDPIAVADASAAVDIPVVMPTAAGVGPPVTAWILDGRLTFVWPASPALPPTREPGIGLLLSEFRGSVKPEYFQKVIGPDTTLTPVTVGDVTGYWISGAPHEIVFVDRYGQPVFDSRRIVGDTLLWARGDVTYRLESGLDRAAAIALAGSLR